MKSCLVLVLIETSTFVYARDIYNFHSLGYSNDGKYYAFAESVVQDGSGFPAANAAVLDVDNNTTISAKRVVLQADNLKESQALKQAIAGVKLPKYRIDSAGKAGETVLIRTNRDRSHYTDTAFSTTYYRTYSLIVEPTSLQGSDCLAGNPELLKLTLKGDEGSGNLVRVLQEDRALPKSRVCANSYKVVRVNQHADKLVVILTFHSPGFEGSDVHYMAVTAKIALP
jgi:predicted secreted protein